MTNAETTARLRSSDFRAAMGRFVTGVTIITSTSPPGHVGMTVNSLTSVSLDPCLLLICLRKGSITGDAIRSHRSFAINLLAGHQDELALRFARPADDRFRGVDFRLDERGAPLIDGCVAWISCELADIHSAGDHDIVLGNVLRSVHDSAGDPLVYRAGAFGAYVPRASAIRQAAGA